MILPSYIKQGVRGTGAIQRLLGILDDPELALDVANVFAKADPKSAYAKAKLLKLVIADISGGDIPTDVLDSSDITDAARAVTGQGATLPDWATGLQDACRVLDESPNLIPYVEKASGRFGTIYAQIKLKIGEPFTVDPAQVAIPFPDGFRWVVLRPDQIGRGKEEAILMGHCGMPGDKTSQMWSLRDTSDMPRLTAEVNLADKHIVSILGPGNGEPSEEYRSYIDALYKHITGKSEAEYLSDWSAIPTPACNRCHGNGIDPEYNHENPPPRPPGRRGDECKQCGGNGKQPAGVEEVTEMPVNAPDWQSPADIARNRAEQILREQEARVADVNIVDQYDTARDVASDTVRGPTDESEPNDFALPWGGNYPGDTELSPDSNDSEKGTTLQPRTGEIAAEFHGLPLVIEWEKGDTREGENADGEKWERKMKADYGYIHETEGEDGDGVDVYVGSDDSDKVFVITQLRDGEYDEDKCMLGFSSPETAEHIYRQHYPNNGMDHFGEIEEISLDDFLTKYMAKKTTNKKRRQKKTATPAGNNMVEIIDGIDGPTDGFVSMFDSIDSGKTNTSEGGDPSLKLGSSDKKGDVDAPYGHAIGPESEYMDKDHEMRITMFARIGRGEDPYVDGIIYDYDDLIPQHQKDVTANWGDDGKNGGQQYLWLRTTMKTADIISESEKWYRKNRNKKWGLEDRDRVLHLANLMMDGATITPLMVSPVGEPKGGCWEGYHRLAAADMLRISHLPVIIKIDPEDYEWQEKVADHEHQPWVAVDLDGTILADGFSDPNGRPPLGEPLPGAKESLQALVDAGMRVSIWTARQYFEEDDKDDAEWQTEIDEHLQYHQIPYTDIYVGKKPPADVFIDDKAVAFKDNWPQVLQEAMQKVQKEAITMEAAIGVEAGWKEWMAALALAVTPVAPAMAQSVKDVNPSNFSQYFPGGTCKDIGPTIECSAPDGTKFKRVKQTEQSVGDTGGAGDAIDALRGKPSEDQQDRDLLRSLIEKMRGTKLTPEEKAQGDAAAKRIKAREQGKTGAAKDEVITMEAVDDPAMFGNNDNKADDNVRGDGGGLSLNGPAQWTSDAVQGPLSGGA